MAIVGFAFTHLHAERTKKLSPKDQIKSELKITNVDFEELPVGKAEETVKFEFDFNIIYGAQTGQTLLKGYVLNVDTPPVTKQIIDNWKNKKKIEPDLMGKVLNMILFKSNIMALNLGQDVNLPPHFKLPRVTVKKGE